MVQYVFTPWRDRYELLLVREQMYTGITTAAQDPKQKLPQDASGLGGSEDMKIHQDIDNKETRARQHQAVARVSMWMQRGNCPHLIESTALLMAAMLSDREAATRENAASSAYAIRAAYSAAFSRFVTGLLDSHQDKQRKQSMYSVADTIGLPATFVELRHQCTHEQLPSLAKLRTAVRKALLWIWDYHWKQLDEDSSDPCRMTILRYLGEGDETKLRTIVDEFERWPKERLFKTIQEVKGSLPGNQAFLKCAQLTQQLKGAEEEKKTTKPGSTDTTMGDHEIDAGNVVEEEDNDFGEGSSNNYAYLVVDDKSNDAVIIDPANPPEVAPILKDAIQAGKINLTAILAELGTPKLDIIGGKDCEGVTKTPGHGETFKLGDITFKGVHTPCHTQDSICFFVQDGNDKAVFTGDTLFIGGCGRFFEGNAKEMHEALNERLAALPDDTVVYPGHEYTKANVKFAASVSQREAVQSLHSFAENNKVTTGKFTIRDEKEHNVFMRVEDPEIQKQTGETEPVAVMAKLREMKNNFNLLKGTRAENMSDGFYSEQKQAQSMGRIEERPPKRKAPAAGGSAPKTRQSKLAKEHNVTPQEEGEIREAFSLFAEPMDGEKYGVLPIDDVKSALIALGVPPSSYAELKEFVSILDPDNDGYATFEPFFAICALKFHTREHDSDAHRAEVEEAFRLFTNGQDGPITLGHLRRVAAVLKEDVDEELLKDMILEANGGVGVARGVGAEEFDRVMKSAGVWR
ncbi:Las1-like-domain-containing protein [Fusarium venenatum]|uniref:Las1-like-domain-containing protein n=1 Tax=Fusarium venenatum TaxID=56646 RepID=UPI001DBDD8EB|nr:Las1-like-domain-containing protein [Fusarium venenatum]